MSKYGSRRSVGSSEDVIGPADFSWDEGQGLPTLAEFVGRCRFDDASRRLPGSVTLFVEDGRLKACLSDKQEGLVGFVTLGALEHALADLEVGLEKDVIEWRRSKDRRSR